MSTEHTPHSVLGNEREVRLIRAIGAHRKVNPDAYRGLGLTVTEEAAMAAALHELEEQYEDQVREADAMRAAAMEAERRADRNQHHLNVERDANAKTVRHLNEQLERAMSDDFSLVPKDEYERLKRIEEQHAALQREYEDLERRLADCSQTLANDDGVFV